MCFVLCALSHPQSTNHEDLFFFLFVFCFSHSSNSSTKELDAFSSQVCDPGRRLARWCQQRRVSICRSAGRDADDLPADWPRVARQRQRLAANFCNSTRLVCAPRTPRADDATVQATTSCCRLQAAPVPVCPLWRCSDARFHGNREPPQRKLIANVDAHMTADVAHVPRSRSARQLAPIPPTRSRSATLWRQ